MSLPYVAASTCWNSVPATTGNMTAGGKNCAAMTAPHEMLRMPHWKTMHTVPDTSCLAARARASPTR